MDGKVAKGPQASKPSLFVSPVEGAGFVLPTKAFVVGQPASVTAAFEERQPNCAVLVVGTGSLALPAAAAALPNRFRRLSHDLWNQPRGLQTCKNVLTLPEQFVATALALWTLRRRRWHLRLRIRQAKWQPYIRGHHLSLRVSAAGQKLLLAASQGARPTELVVVSHEERAAASKSGQVSKLMLEQLAPAVRPAQLGSPHINT